MSSQIYATTLTDFGWVAVAASPSGLTAVTLPQPQESEAMAALGALPADARPDSDGVLAPVLARLRRYYRGEAVEFDDVLDMGHATSFQRQVWQATRQVARGATTTYGELAVAVGAGPAAARAVGRCMATNPWPPLVPCHRVLGKNGALTGFGGGIETKRRMLEMEGALLLLG
jgi:methylated-DNA-[protein]-cysteine S-methyltransferase